jgi:hypothetical protein
MDAWRAVGDFGIIKSRSLAEALGHKASLVALNGAISVALDSVDPTRSNGLLTRREFDNLPSPVLKVHEILLLHRLAPMSSVW